jgi:predicted Zn-dependent protease
MTRLSLLSARYDIYKKHIKEIDELAKKDIEIASYLIPYYLKEKNYKKAEEISKSILKKDHSLKNYQLLVSLYIDTKEYKKAQKVLDDYTKRNGCEPAICGMKLFLKTKEGDVKGIEKLLKELYKATGNQSFEIELLKLYLSLGKLDELEKYVRSSKSLKKDVLIDIYTSVKKYKKAEKIALELYKESKKPFYLADSAIYLYEAEYKKNPKVLKEVIDRFEKSVSKVDKPFVYNYYGYLLIDHDVDIKKGIELVKKALKKKPKNEYYLDSLAWGYYKIGKCKEALKILENLKDKEQEEIKEHIKKAKECLKR